MVKSNRAQRTLLICMHRWNPPRVRCRRLRASSTDPNRPPGDLRTTNQQDSTDAPAMVASSVSRHQEINFFGPRYVSHWSLWTISEPNDTLTALGRVPRKSKGNKTGFPHDALVRKFAPAGRLAPQDARQCPDPDPHQTRRFIFAGRKLVASCSAVVGSLKARPVTPRARQEWSSPRRFCKPRDEVTSPPSRAG